MKTNSHRTPLFRFLFAAFLVVALLTSTVCAVELSDADLSDPDASSQESASADPNQDLDSQESGDQNPDNLEQSPNETDPNAIENPPLVTTTPNGSSTRAFSPLSVGTVIIDEDDALVTAFQPGHTYTYHVTISNTSTADVQGAALHLSVMNNVSSISEDSGIIYIVRLLGDNIQNSNGYNQDTNYQDQRLTSVKAASGYGRLNCAYVSGSAKLITPSQPNGVTLPDIELFNSLGTTAGFTESGGVFGAGRENAVELVFQVVTTSIAAENDLKDTNSDGAQDTDDAALPNAEESPDSQSTGNAAAGSSSKGAVASIASGFATFGSALTSVVLVLILVVLLLLNWQVYVLNCYFRECCRQQGIEPPSPALLLGWRKQEPSDAICQDEPNKDEVPPDNEL